MAPTPVEATAISNFANAWTTYFQGASVSGASIGSLAAAKSAMQGALVGMSAPNAGAAKIQAGITAFWGVIVASGASLWVITPSIITLVAPPPTLGGIAAALSGVFASNAADPTKTIAQATNAIATVLHTNGGLGGIATVQPPPVALPSPPLFSNPWQAAFQHLYERTQAVACTSPRGPSRTRTC